MFFCMFVLLFADMQQACNRFNTVQQYAVARSPPGSGRMLARRSIAYRRRASGLGGDKLYYTENVLHMVCWGIAVRK